MLLHCVPEKVHLCILQIILSKVNQFFGVLNPEKIWHQFNSLYICSPHLYTVVKKSKKSHFSTVLFMHTSDYLRYLRRKHPSHLKNVTALPCKMQNFFIWLKVCCIPPNVGGSERSRLWIGIGGSEKNCDTGNYIHITQPSAKYVPNCDVSFANSELHQAYGHVTLTISAWPKYGHRSLVGCRLPLICSYSWHPCVYGLTPWVVLFSDDVLCLRSWHRTNQWHDSLLPRDPLWLTCSFLLPNLSDLPDLLPMDFNSFLCSSCLFR